MADNKIEHFISCGHLNTFRIYYSIPLLMTPCGDDDDDDDGGYRWDIGVPPFPAPSHTWQLYVYVLSSLHSKDASEPICTWHLELKTATPSGGSLMTALKMRNAFHNTHFDAARCFWSILSPNWGHEWAVNKDFDGVPRENGSGGEAILFSFQ